MTDHMKIAQKIRGEISTHDCPECGGPSYCAMESGKSANLCWCMDVPRAERDVPMVGARCLCRRCITEPSKK